MRVRIGDRRDFIAGLLFAGIGGAFLALGAKLPFGSAAQMGPGYLPRVISAALVIIGALVALRGLKATHQSLDGWAWRPLLLVVFATLAFAFSVERLGLVIAIFLAIGIGGHAASDAKPLHLLALATALSAFSVAVFIYGFRLPAPIWPALGG